MIVVAGACEGMQLLWCWDSSGWPAPAQGWRVRAVWASSMWRRPLDQTDSDISMTVCSGSEAKGRKNGQRALFEKPAWETSVVRDTHKALVGAVAFKSQRESMESAGAGATGSVADESLFTLWKTLSHPLLDV